MPLTSVWEKSHPSLSLPVAVPDVPEQADVVVVGAGITGLTTALLLGRAGRDVVVLEARHVGAGTTGRSTAKVSLLQGTRLSKISAQHSPDLVQQYVDGNHEGQAWLADFCATHGVAVQRRPALTYAQTAQGVRQVREELRAAQDAGLPVEWVDDLPLPFPTRGAVRLDDQLQLDPLELLEALRSQAEQHGVRIVEGVRFRGATGRQPIRVRTTAGDVRASTLVLATNMPTLDRGGFFARMTPARSYGLSFRVDRPPVDGIYLSADVPSRSLRDAPSGDGPLLLVGGNGHTTGRSGSTALRLEELRRWTAELWPDAVETSAWSAQDYVPHQELPFAGPILPGRPDLQVAGGYAKWGMTNGVAAARVISSEILGGQVSWRDAFGTGVHLAARGIGKTAGANATVGAEMATGWLRPLRHIGVGPGPGPGPAEGAGRVELDRVGRPPTATSRVDGVERRISGVCTHLGGVVRWNDAERSWDCPLHGSRYDADGELLEGPATCGLRQR
jgi:glycine/D-amino acid oxidase-like deaminating enzyme/nitrite reductase/ring-hydroxylating ferredoxin subunit